MPLHHVLDPEPIPDLVSYQRTGGGEALAAARDAGPEAVLSVVEASGLRGRGGAGFPTGTKWRTVAGMGGSEPATVVVNAAEGEPGTLKDRTLLRRNPFRVLEGALIGALAVGADRVVVGMKRSSRDVAVRVERAIHEIEAAGLSREVELEWALGSERYLLGEETALLEALDGRPPFPRVAPPYRAGAEEGAPALVNNVESFANVPAIVRDGAEAFRSRGTAESPGTIVCTVSGRTERAGVGEFELGTPLREVIETLGGSPLVPPVVAVLSGTVHPLLPASALDAPVSWEGLAEAGGGLGSAGFIVLDAGVDLVAVAQGVSRFLSVESCGQCTPCKVDGESVTAILDRIRLSAPEADDLEELPGLVGGLTEGARCYLAQQHQSVVESLLARFPDAVAAHAEGRADPAGAYPIVPLADIVDDQPVLDLDQLAVEPDWGIGTDSGATPADRIDTHAR